MWLARNRVFMKGLRRVKRVDSGLVGWTLDAVIIAGTLAVMGWWWHSPALTERPHTTAAEMGLQIGYHATIAGVSWNQSERTLFLAVRTTCPACNASVAYYRRLFDACATCRGCRDLVVSLEPRETVDAWLRKNHINARHVVTATLSTVPGLHTTPTVAIVDSSGIITDLDIGMLGSDREARFLARTVRRPGAAVAVPERQPRVVNLSRDLQTLMHQIKVPILDVREREACDKRHDQRFVCLPLEELAARAPAEFDLDSDIVVDCSCIPRTSCLKATERLMANGFARVSVAVDGPESER
jgi:rhodanese-related sulfurtransferase